MDLGMCSTFVIDWDGTLVQGDKEVPGATSLLRFLVSAGRDICIASNNSQWTGEHLTRAVERIHGLPGIPAITVCDIVASAINELAPGGTVAVLGGNALVESCRDSDATIVFPPTERCDTIVIGYHDSICWKHLEWVASQIDRGVPVLATNADPFRVGAGGVRVPETGSILAALEVFTAPVWNVLGKPAPRLLQAGLDRVHARAESAVMIGDRLDTDIACANTLGMATIWLRPDGYGDLAEGAADFIVSELSQISARLPRISR